MKEPILFFYLKTGGGHFAPVRALANYIQTAHPGLADPVLVDGMAGAGSFARFMIEDGYRITQARAKWIYETAYAVTKFPPATRANSELARETPAQGDRGDDTQSQARGDRHFAFLPYRPGTARFSRRGNWRSPRSQSSRTRTRHIRSGF